jgi:HAD superfamily hydrolase (TIGR01509 family)
MADAPEVRAVLFDLDDTLFDHSHSTRAVLSGLYHRYDSFRGLDFEAFLTTHTRLLDHLHVEVLSGRRSVDDARLERIRRLYASVGESPPADVIASVSREYRAAYVDSWTPVAGALELLAMLHGRVRIGVVTNNVVVEQVHKVDRCGFTPYLDALVISEEVGMTKPEPGIFRVALERLGVDAAGTVMVGDAWAPDIVGALGAGIRAVWLNRSGLARPDPSLPAIEITSLEPPADVAERILCCPRLESRSHVQETRILR